jgi:hypothetical protein
MKIYVIILFALSLLMTETVTAQTVDGVLDKSMKDFVDAEFKKNNLEVTSPLGIQRKKLFYSLMALKRNPDGTFVNEKALQTLQKAIEENQKNIIIQQYQEAANKTIDVVVPKSYQETLKNHTCKWCGNNFTNNGFGYSIVNDAGRKKIEVWKASILDAQKYDTYECAREAGYKELRGY